MQTISHEMLDQSRRDITVAQQLKTLGFHEWACYAAQQSAEKAVKAVRIALGSDADSLKTHAMTLLFSDLAFRHAATRALLVQAVQLDVHNLQSRYPSRRNRTVNAPYKTYGLADADAAIAIARKVLEYAEFMFTEISTFWSRLRAPPA